MKSLLIILFFLLSFKTFGQTYYSFPLSNTIWNIYLNDTWYQTNTEMKRYAFFNDTIEINNKVYSKLYEIDDTTLNCGNAAYIFPFREDSSKKVFFLFDTTEVLLYDFSLNVGDTIFYDYLIQSGLSPYEHYKRLDSTGTVDINGQMRKIFYLSGGISGNTWIEGIGAIDGEGLFAPVTDICLCGLINILACVKENDTVLWVDNPICGKCFCNLYVSNPESYINNYISVFPNPAIEKIIIDIKEKASLEIVNIQGKTIYTRSLQENSNIVDISDLKTGIYFLRFKSEDGVAVRKLVVE